MRTGTILATLLLAGTVLSGCIGGEGGGTQSTQTVAAFDDTTGAIEGLVHDDALVPIQGAEVGLLDVPEARATTDEAGRFVLSHIPPGEHQVAAQRIGYQSTTRSVVVNAGEIATTELTLLPAPTVQPYHLVKDQRGLFGCGASWRPAVAVSGIAACGVLSLVLNLTQYDKFLLTWRLTGNVSEWEGAAFEMNWKTTQAFGKGLTMIWETNGCSNNRNSTFARKSGSSPLQVVLNSTRLESARDNNSASTCTAKTNCDDKKCQLQSRVFSEPDTLGPSSPADVGITIQQPFTQYLTEFYNMEPPPGYSAIKDT